MKKFQKLLERISSKLTVKQAIFTLAVCGIVFILVLVYDAKDYKFDMPLNLLWILFGGLTFIFADISIEKTVDNLIERETKTILQAIKHLLSDEYKLVKYDGDLEIFELYDDATKSNNQKLYAKLDVDDNICYAIIDDYGNIISEKKSKKYRFFLENIYVCY